MWGELQKIQNKHGRVAENPKKSMTLPTDYPKGLKLGVYFVLFLTK